MTTPRQMEPAIVARAVNSRLRVGRLTQAGQAITLTQTDATTGPTCLLAARLLLAPGERTAVTDDLAQEVTASPPGREGKQLMSVLSRQQVRLQRAMNVHGLGVLPWPKALGSTPWSVARQMTEIVRTCTPGGGRRRYTVRWVSDHGPAWGGEVASIREVLAGGLPVILVTGSSSTPTPRVSPRRGRGCARPWHAPRPCPATTSWPCPGRPSGRTTPVRGAHTSTSPPAAPCAPST